jgi:hypothetical protein
MVEVVMERDRSYYLNTPKCSQARCEISCPWITHLLDQFF